MNQIAIYAGTFDPITNGHLDILERSLSVFSKVYLAVVGGNPQASSKSSYFSTDERVELAKASVHDYFQNEALNKIEVCSFDGILVEFAKKINASVIVRGLRAVSDYEHESQLAHINRLLAPQIETIFFVTSGVNSFISSSIARNIALNGGDVSQIVPQAVVNAFSKK